eukprot:gene6009-9226_t
MASIALLVASSLWAAEPIPDGIYTIRTGELSLDVDGFQSASNVFLSTDDGSNSQKWSVSGIAESNYYTIINWESGLALDVFQSYTDDGNTVLQYPYYAQTNQQWSIEKGDCGYRIMSRVSSKFLDVGDANPVDGADVIQWSRVVGRLTQVWSFTLTVPFVFPDGVYTIRNAGYGMNMDVDGKSSSATAGITVREQDYHRSQQWRVSRSGSFYTFVNVNSGLALDVPGSSVSDGVALIQYYFNQDQPNQQFSLEAAGGGFLIRSRVSSKFVDVDASSDAPSDASSETAEGADVYQWSRRETGETKIWNLLPPATRAPLTEAPPTNAPPTLAPPTAAPPTMAPPTNAPPTVAPPTNAPPTEAPPTEAPPTIVPTSAPATHAPCTATVAEGKYCMSAPACCEAGTTCFVKNSRVSLCLETCPDSRHWSCAVDTRAPIPWSCDAAVSEGESCSAAPACCAAGTRCYKTSRHGAQCLKECFTHFRRACEDLTPVLRPTEAPPTDAPPTPAPCAEIIGEFAPCGAAPACCASGTTCFVTKNWGARCLEECSWCPVAAPAPPSCDASIPEGSSCLSAPSCCAAGTKCYRKNRGHAQCLK